MTKVKVGMSFSRPFEGNDPLGHIGKKLPVYVRLLEFCQQRGWETYILTRRTYQGKGVYNGAWRFANDNFARVEEPLKMDLVYDRTAGVVFPSEGDSNMVVVNQRAFKLLCWDKWAIFKEIGQFMPQTVWVGGQENLASALGEIRTEWVVLKPYNGLKGIGVFAGPKDKALALEFPRKYPQYIAQEFVDTSGGISGIIKGYHDLRVVVTNGKAVWSHVRTPPPGSFRANVALGGDIKEVACSDLPVEIKQVVDRLAKQFNDLYDNPIYSLDFGVGKNGPEIFEINDQIGFPLWEMKVRDDFLHAHIENFAHKLE